MDSSIISALDALILTLAPAFQARSARNFATLVWGVLLCLGKPTVTNLARAVGEPKPALPSRLHRFFSRAVWDVEHLFRLLLVEILIPHLAPTGELVFAGDDTTAGKSGRRVALAGHFRNAVASTRTECVLHWSHNWVLLCLIVPCPLSPDRLLHIPVLARVYRREADCSAAHPFRTRNQMLREMITLVASWLPERRIVLVADGAYAAAEAFVDLPPAVRFLSRLRRDARLYAPPPPRTGKRGRPHVKGARLPKLEAIAAAAPFHAATVLIYGRRREVLTHTFEAVWYAVWKKPLQVVIVRDPSGAQPDDFFFTNRLGTDPFAVAEQYAARWGVEEAIREAKQSLGFDEVQSWSAKAVERQAPFVLVVQALAHIADLHARHASTEPTPHSFARTLTAIRIQVWTRRIHDAFDHGASREKMLELLENTLFTAA
jgi:hypothetical protein